MITMPRSTDDPRKAPAQPKVKALKPNPQPPAKKLVMPRRDPRRRGG
jgi:hypothetical protein